MGEFRDSGCPNATNYLGRQSLLPGVSFYQTTKNQIYKAEIGFTRCLKNGLAPGEAGANSKGEDS